MLNKILFRSWIAIWTIPLMVISIFTPWNFLAFAAMVFFVILLVAIGHFQIFNNMEWSDWFDWTLGYLAIAFLGSTFAIFLPRVYDMNETLKWTSFSNIMLIIWSLSLIFGISLMLIFKWRLLNLAQKVILAVVNILFIVGLVMYL